MEKQINCTLTDICIDYLVKNNFQLSIEPNNEWSEWNWQAEREDLILYATDPIRLVALYMIRDDWVSDREVDKDYIPVIADDGNTYRYAVCKLVQWGYTVSRVEDSADFGVYEWLAEKDGKTYSAEAPLGLLGFVTIMRAYGEDWTCSDVAKSFSINPIPGRLDDIELIWGKTLDLDQIEQDDECRQRGKRIQR